MDFLKLQGKIVVWPANLDSTKSRKEGRKLTKGLAIQAPRLEEMNEATRRLSLEGELAAGKSRPSVWWEKGGYLVLPKKEAKAELLRDIASEIRKLRAEKGGHEKERK
jgi:signal recognition particle subunit SRP19